MQGNLNELELFKTLIQKRSLTLDTPITPVIASPLSVNAKCRCTHCPSVKQAKILMVIWDIEQGRRSRRGLISEIDII